MSANIFSVMLVLVWALAFLMAALGVGMFAQGRTRWLYNEGMPPLLRHARLIMNETPIRGPCGRSMRVGQVFQLRNGSVVVVDTKTRDYSEVRDSDIEQITDYRLALAEVYGYKLAPFAYVRCVAFPDHEVDRMVTYLKIKYGKTRG